MKIIIFLALAGVSLAHDFTCLQPYQPANTVECLKNALTIAPDFLDKLKKFVCEYYGPIQKNKARYVDALNELIEILKCAGCAVDELLGTDETAEQLLGDTGETAKNAVYNVLKALDRLGLIKLVADTLCNVLNLGGDGGLLG